MKLSEANYEVARAIAVTRGLDEAKRLVKLASAWRLEELAKAYLEVGWARFQRQQSYAGLLQEGRRLELLTVASAEARIMAGFDACPACRAASGGTVPRTTAYGPLPHASCRKGWCACHYETIKPAPGRGKVSVVLIAYANDGVREESVVRALHANGALAPWLGDRPEVVATGFAQAEADGLVAQLRALGAIAGVRVDKTEFGNTRAKRPAAAVGLTDELDLGSLQDPVRKPPARESDDWRGPCSACRGIGAVAVVCAACDGKGRVGGFLGMGKRGCALCDGAGAVRRSCLECGGHGLGRGEGVLK